MVDTSRTMSTPGVSTGTMIIDEPEYGCTSGLVTAITIRKSATDPLDVNHLCPLITHSSPSRMAAVFKIVGSDPAASAQGRGIAGTRMMAATNPPPEGGLPPLSRCEPPTLKPNPTSSNSAFPESGALLP